MKYILGFLVALLLGLTSDRVYGEELRTTMSKIEMINGKGISYLGLVVPNHFEMNPLLQSPSFVLDETLPHLDISGRRFRLGKVGNESVILVMTGLSMLNAGVATELLLTFFKVKAVLHFGIAGNADPELQIGDVVIPQYWAHTGLWNWQRYGDGPENELALESNGDYTREFGHFKFGNYNDAKFKHSSSSNNLLNNGWYTQEDILWTSDPEPERENLLGNVWYQPEEIFPIDSTPEVRQHAFWVPVDNHLYSLAQELEGMKLEKYCINSTCLPRPSKVFRVERGSSANVFIDNEAYGQWLHSKFNITAIDMESAAVGLICLQHRTPFIAFRALSDLAGGKSSFESNEASKFASLASQNAVSVVLQFIKLLS